MRPVASGKVTVPDKEKCNGTMMTLGRESESSLLRRMSAHCTCRTPETGSASEAPGGSGIRTTTGTPRPKSWRRLTCREAVLCAIGKLETASSKCRGLWLAPWSKDSHPHDDEIDSASTVQSKVTNADRVGTVAFPHRFRSASCATDPAAPPPAWRVRGRESPADACHRP